MKLSNAEFKAMNGGIRRFFHRRVEFPTLVRLGLRECTGKDVVELGCGHGFGAELIAKLGPRSYVGLDVMPEQIALASQARSMGRHLFGSCSRLIVIPELPKQAAPEPPERTEAPGVKVWVLPGAFGLRVLSANLPRPAGAKLMRLVAEERDQQALNMLDALASR